MSKDYQFTGTMAEMYDRAMGPVMFEPYAEDMAARVPIAPETRILEVAAGTGRLTRHLLARLPESGNLRATDLNLDMLAVAQRDISDPRVDFEIADAVALPFAAGEFDVVVCQFGVMFFPDKGQAYREAYRVLRPDGIFLFSAWGSHARNPWAGVCHRVMQEAFPDDPIPFMKKPFGYHDQREIVETVDLAGFAEVRSEWRPFELVAESAGAFARGLVTGTPLLDGINERGGDPETCVHLVAEAFRREFGDHPMQSTMSALVVTARK